MGRSGSSARVKVEAGPTVTRKSRRKVDGSTGLPLKQRLAEALEQHAAISEILQVISASPSDVQPVVDAVAERAARLCQAPLARVLFVDGDILRATAEYSLDGTYPVGTVPLPLKRTTIVGRAVLDRVTIHHDDVVPLLDSEYPDALNARRLGLRAVLAVPLMRKGDAYGVIFLWRREPGLFSAHQVALVETFAQQVSIAIDNVRLFNETKEALDQQRASGEVLAAISSSIADTKPVFDKILQSCERLFAGTLITIHILGEDGLTRIVAHQGPNREAFMASPPAPVTDQRATGICIQRRTVLHYPDTEDEAVPLGTREAGRLVGTRAAIFAPMLWEGRAIGVIAVCRVTVGPFSDKEIALLKTFADQAVIAIQNARLFHEIQDKSRQLEMASRHKSEFLANMSHELRTPLNAIIGFSEVLAEKMFGEINEKQAEYLADILESGRHLLSLINDILDLSKIEAGRMELEPTDFDLADAIESTLILVRERAHRHGITLGRTVEERLGVIRADERKVKQVLLNLLSNALKFTSSGGTIDVVADARDGEVTISVRDTGVGIAAEDQKVVFEEFRQVGTASKKVEGTGLGLAISRKFIELHGGRIWVESQVGLGSTFAFTLPLTIDLPKKDLKQGAENQASQ
jgi:signal transduction histidine kinase